MVEVVEGVGGIMQIKIKDLVYLSKTSSSLVYYILCCLSVHAFIIVYTFSFSLSLL